MIWLFFFETCGLDSRRHYFSFRFKVYACAKIKIKEVHVYCDERATWFCCNLLFLTESLQISQSDWHVWPLHCRDRTNHVHVWLAVLPADILWSLAASLRNITQIVMFCVVTPGRYKWQSWRLQNLYLWSKWKVDAKPGVWNLSVAMIACGFP